MPWQAGQSGNPAGRPARGKAIADILNRILDEPSRDGAISNRERLCRVAVASAMEGNLKALGWVADRAEGRALMQNSEQIHEAIGPIRIIDFDSGEPEPEEEDAGHR